MKSIKKIFSFVTLFLIAIAGQSQIYQKMNSWYEFNRAKITQMLRLPQDTLAGADSGSIAYMRVSNKMYIKSGYWQELTGGAGGGTTNLTKTNNTTTVTITPTGGTPAVLDAATTGQAGIMTSAMKYSLDSAVTKILALNDSVTGYYNSKGQLIKTDTGKAFVFEYPIKVVGQSAKLDYDTNSLVIINNKLAAKVTTVKNIGELRSLPSYDTAYVYRLVQNKVVGDFYYLPGCSDADDSAMNISVSGGCLKRYTAGIIRPEYFGAINNDLLDDTYSIQRMWTWIGANSGADKREEYTVIFTGKYIQSATVNVPKFLYTQGAWPTIRVMGYGATIVLTGAITGMKRVPANMNEAIFDSQNMIGNTRWIIEGLTFLGDATTGQKGIDMGALYSANIHDNYFSGLDTGMVLRFMLGSVIMNNQFIQNKSAAGVLSWGNWTGATVNNSAFNANYITRNRVYCASGSYTSFLMEGGDGNDINNLIIEGFKPQYGIEINSQASSVVNGNHLRQIWFEAGGGVYTVNTSMRLRVNGIMTVESIQNDYADTLIDWSGSAAGADISLDNVEYWNFSVGKYFKGAPASGMIFRIGRIYGKATDSLFDASKYADGVPADIFSLYGYQTVGGGYGIGSNSQISLKPNINAGDNVKLINVVGNVKPSVNNTYDLGSGSLKWNFVYGNKLLAGLTSDDGSGSKLQSGGAISLADGSQIFEPTGLSFFKVSTANGTEIGYGSGGTLGKVQINPNLDYIYGGTTKFRVYSGGNVRMGATISNHGEVLQVDGTSWFNGTVQIVDGSQGLNKVLTSDASGLASWQTPSGGSGITGLTTNTIPKATSGTSIGNSTITDNASLITLGLPTNVTGALKPSTDNTYTLGSFANRWSELYVKAKGYFNLAADDGSGAIVQIGGSASLSDGSSLREPSNTSSFIVSTGVGTQVKYGLGNLQVNPHVSYTYNSVEVGRWYSNGNFRLGSISDNGDKLQVDGTSWLNGRVKFNFTNLAASPSYLIAKQTDSSLSEISFPGGTTSFLAGNGTFQTPTNIYNTDGTLSTNRTVSGAETYDINFSTVDTFGIQGNAVYLNPVNNTAIGGAVGFFSKQTITSGTATTISNNVVRVLVNPGSLLSTHTITLPASPHDGDEIKIFFGGTIAGAATVVTTLTISANGGQTLMQATTPSMAVGGDCIIYSYNTSNTTWYRIK